MTTPSRRGPEEGVHVVESAATGAAQRDDGKLSFIAPVMGLIRRWRVIIVLPLAFALLAAAFTAVTGVNYIAESRFAPYARDAQLSSLAGVAAQFGISVGSGGQGESVEFYAQLLQSRELLQEVVLSGYADRLAVLKGDTVGTALLTLWDVKGDTREEQLLEAVRRLRDVLHVSTDLRANILTVRTEAKSTWLAEQINRRLLDLVNEFNVAKRQSQATAERRFAEARMKEARFELLAAEDSLQRFLTTNRSYEQSPTLRFEAGRLERLVDFRQQVFTALAQSFEQARIDEVRNTPVINILDAPEGSAESREGIGRSGLKGFLFGALLAVVLALAIELWQRQRREQPTEYEALIAQLRRTLREMRSLSTWLRPPG